MKPSNNLEIKIPFDKYCRVQLVCMEAQARIESLVCMKSYMYESLGSQYQRCDNETTNISFMSVETPEEQVLALTEQICAILPVTANEDIWMRTSNKILSLKLYHVSCHSVK